MSGVRLRSLLGGALALPLAWLGCNGILGIDDAIFVPLDAGANGSETGGPAGDGGPVALLRRTVRVPRGETRTLAVTVDLQGKPGPAKLEPDWALPNDVAVTIAQAAPDQFVVTFVASATATVDQSLGLRAVAASGEELGRNDVRVLVGAPGTLDVSFGPNHDGTVVIESLAVVSEGLATSNRTILVVDERNKIWQIPEDGVGAKIAFGFVLSSNCTTSALAADAKKVVIGGDCIDNSFVGEAALDAPGSDLPHTDLRSDLLVTSVARWGDQTWVLYSDYTALDDRSDVLRHPDGGTTRIWMTTPTSLHARDGGLVAVGTDLEDAVQIARLGGTVSGPLLDAGYTRLGVDSGYLDVPSTAYSAGGTTLVPTVEIDDEDYVELRAIGPNGGLAGRARIRWGAVVAVSADARDRFLVTVADAGPGDNVLFRHFPDAGPDPSFTSVLPRCPSDDLVPALTTVDEDGMIIVRCGGDSLRIYRVWP